MPRRERCQGHRGVILWLTGLSGAGKSSIARSLEDRLNELNAIVHVLDGDDIRRGLSCDLGFSPEDRAENVRRVGEVAKLLLHSGAIIVCALISPLRLQRRHVRGLVEPDEFVEIHVHASLAVCEGRDPKGLYSRARAGEISDFTGIGGPYEAPENPELVLDTELKNVDECTNLLLAYLERGGRLQR